MKLILQFIYYVMVKNSFVDIHPQWIFIIYKFKVFLKWIYKFIKLLYEVQYIQYFIS